MPASPAGSGIALVLARFHEHHPPRGSDQLASNSIVLAQIVIHRASGIACASALAPAIRRRRWDLFIPALAQAPTQVFAFLLWRKRQRRSGDAGRWTTAEKLVEESGCPPPRAGFDGLPSAFHHFLIQVFHLAAKASPESTGRVTGIPDTAAHSPRPRRLASAAPEWSGMRGT